MMVSFPGQSRTGEHYPRRSAVLFSKSVVSHGMALPQATASSTDNGSRRILMFPFGNNVECCSFYLEQGFEEGQQPEGWSCCVQFALVLSNQNDPRIYTSHQAHHRFNPDEGDWGFTRFVENRKMFNVPWNNFGRPLVENDTAVVTAYVRIVKDETGVLWHNFVNYDSHKETGYVGLKNQGATCYLNSLLQSLYFTNAFRKVCQIS